MYSGWLRQPRTIIADSGLSGASRDVIVAMDLEIYGNQLGTLVFQEKVHIHVISNCQQLQIEVSHFAGSMCDVAWTMNSQVAA